VKIIGLTAQNVMNLKAIEIKAEGNSVTLSGKNGVGKSSVIDAITMALTGKMVERPIKDGETRAEVEIDLGTYKVRRIWTEGGDKLEVMSKDGAKYPKPQALLNEIIGKLTFDPLAFKEMGKDAEGRRKQRDLLVKLVGLDFAKLDSDYKATYDLRAIVNRDVMAIEGRLSGQKAPAEGVPVAEISLGAELTKVGELEKQKKGFDDAVKHIAEIKANIEEHAKSTIILETKYKERVDLIRNTEDQRIADLEAEIARIKNKANDDITKDKKETETAINNRSNLIEHCNAQLAEAETPPEITQAQIDAARLELTKIEGINTAVRQAKAYNELKGSLDTAMHNAGNLTEQLDKLAHNKETAIVSAQYPIPGLSVSDDGVLFEGIPFSQVSDGKKLIISASIAMKLNPTLKVIFLREASFLDTENRKAIRKMALDKGYQLWEEVVGDEKEIGIHFFSEPGQGIEKPGQSKTDPRD